MTHLRMRFDIVYLVVRLVLLFFDINVCYEIFKHFVFDISLYQKQNA